MISRVNNGYVNSPKEEKVCAEKSALAQATSFYVGELH